jgi:hypothetical protein
MLIGIEVWIDPGHDDQSWATAHHALDQRLHLG